MWFCKLLIMSKIKNIIEKIRHSYYGIMKVLAFVLALAIIVLLMPRNVKFKYEYQKMTDRTGFTGTELVLLSRNSAVSTFVDLITWMKNQIPSMTMTF